LIVEEAGVDDTADGDEDVDEGVDTDVESVVFADEDTD